MTSTGTVRTVTRDKYIRILNKQRKKMDETGLGCGLTEESIRDLRDVSSYLMSRSPDDTRMPFVS